MVPLCGVQPWNTRFSTPVPRVSVADRHRPRPAGAIGFASVRGGDVVGERLGALAAFSPVGGKHHVDAQRF